jgi:hypothetical protein
MCGSPTIPVAPPQAASVPAASGATIVESLAGTGKRYVQLQARIKEDYLHVQVVAPNAKDRNRPYGLSTDVTPPNDILVYFKQATKVTDLLDSQANTKRQYLPMQATTIGYGNEVHLQARDGKLNREYGLAFNIEDDDLHSFVTNLLNTPTEATSQEVSVATHKGTLSLNANEYEGIVILDEDGEEFVVVKGKTACIPLRYGDMVATLGEDDTTIKLKYDDGNVMVSIDGDTNVEVETSDLTFKHRN